MQQIHTTDYASIHVDKENIKPIPQGRSANKLQELIHTDTKTLQSQLTTQRQEYENSLNPSILQDLDDPLDSYLKYINWIRENYPTGNTHESLLIQVLERTTHDFKDDDYYKNEIRYFKVWLEYITYSDHSGNVFNYLLKKKIGCDLSLFYENYSLFFELNDQWENAQDILKLGISKKSRPLTRLLKSYDEFLARKTAKSLTVQTTNPLKGLSNPDGTGLVNKSANVIRSQSKSSKIQVFNDSAKPKKSSLAIFQDNNSDKSPRLDTIKHSKKENTINPVSWKGETLKNSAKPPVTESKKIEVFNDTANQYPITKTIMHPDGKRMETFDFNFDLYLPPNGNPMTMVEVMLQFHKQPKPVVADDKENTVSKKRSTENDVSFNTPLNKKQKFTLDDLADLDVENTDSNSKSPGITDTPLLEYFKHTKGGLFSVEEDDEGTENANPEKPKNLFNQAPKKDTNEKDENITQNNLLDAIIGGAFSDIFTDTVTKQLDPKTPSKYRSTKVDDDDGGDDLLSSPFVENPLDNKIKPIPSVSSTVNPFDPVLKSKVLKTIEIFIFQNHNIHNFDTVSMNKLPVLNKIFKPNGPPIHGNKEALLEFEKDHMFCVTKELGRGGFATVYLSEKMDGQSNAIKVESQSDLWETYILSKLNQKSNDFIKLYGAYKYSDESYLILPYLQQGTVLDLMNSLSNYQYMTGKNLIEESFVIYFSIQLLSKVLKLHSFGFIHCDIKPDNCMLNIDNLNSKLKFNDLQLIDFGRSIDTSLFPADIKFQCKFENTDNQDCPEFVNNIAWRYEPDYYGIANVIHTLLFNKHIIAQTTKDGVQLIEAFKHYWQRDLWNELFGLLLNPRKYNADGDITKELEKVKGKLESWFNLTVDKRVFLEKLRQIAEILNTRSKKMK